MTNLILSHESNYKIPIWTSCSNGHTVIQSTPKFLFAGRYYKVHVMTNPDEIKARDFKSLCGLCVGYYGHGVKTQRKVTCLRCLELTGEYKPEIRARKKPIRQIQDVDLVVQELEKVNLTLRYFRMYEGLRLYHIVYKSNRQQYAFAYNITQKQVIEKLGFKKVKGWGDGLVAFKTRLSDLRQKCDSVQEFKRLIEARQN